jgi:cytochrome c oxidase subunit 3
MATIEIGNIQENQKQRARVSMLWVGIIAIIMFFAAITSGFILSMGGPAWISVDVPMPFIYSTFIIIFSSATMYWAQLSAKKGNAGGIRLGAMLTFLLGLVFGYSQYMGFIELFASGHAFSSKNPADSFMYLIPVMHFTHLLGGLIALLVVARRAKTGKYTAQNHLGVRLCGIYWHFLDILWLYLFAFLYLIR